MIEDIMNLTTRIINECSGRWTKFDKFVLHTVKDNETPFVQIDALNNSHTTKFKIRAKQSDLGLIFKYPLVYENEDALLRKWKLRRMNSKTYPDRFYVNLLQFEEVFDIGCDPVDYSELKRLLLCGDTDQIAILNNGCENVYSTILLKSMIIQDAGDIKLKLLHQDGPLILNYKFRSFDVYCLIAPRITTESRFYLRV